jgi:hypothetical protein
MTAFYAEPYFQWTCFNLVPAMDALSGKAMSTMFQFEEGFVTATAGARVSRRGGHSYS